MYILRKVLLAGLGEGLLGEAGLGVEGLVAGFLGAEGLGLAAGLAVVRGGDGTWGFSTSFMSSVSER